MTQNQIVLKHLKSGKSLTSMEAFKLYGITRLAACVWDITDEQGIKISREMIRVQNRFRKNIFVAKYFLEKSRSKKK